MKRGLLLGLALAACAHTAPETAALPLTSVTPAAKSAPDVSWEEAQAALLAGKVTEASHLFGAFADAFPEDDRAGHARLQQAWATLAVDDDPARATEHATALLERVRPDAGVAEQLSELRAVLEARRRLHDEAQRRNTDLAACRTQLQAVGDLERDLAGAKAAAAKLAQELTRKQRELEDVKQRLLEIQQLAAEMLGVPKPGAAKPAPPAPVKAQ
ncbi:MAG TPA: hypothetical protein VMB50_08345 [Myxococcales bacterium]|nr:hypothetical protein [Myxococcales bacterium]